MPIAGRGRGKYVQPDRNWESLVGAGRTSDSLKRGSNRGDMINRKRG